MERAHSTSSGRRAPEAGTTTADGTGPTVSVSYKPASYYAGSDQFMVQVMDLFGNYDTIVVRVRINPVNDPGKAVFIFE